MKSQLSGGKYVYSSKQRGSDAVLHSMQYKEGIGPTYSFGCPEKATDDIGAKEFFHQLSCPTLNLKKSHVKFICMYNEYIF